MSPAPAPVQTPSPVPTVVLGGYLGAGKTTLLNHLLRHANGVRVAVLVNDFGEINIDADLIEGASGEVLALAGGCVCCSYGQDLMGALQQVVARTPAPDVVVVECSGVGLPASVARTARLVPEVQVLGVVGVVDASNVAERLADPYLADTVLQQLQQADLLVINKVDVTSAEAVRHHFSAELQQTPWVAATRGQVEASVVLGLHASPRERAPSPGLAPPGRHHAVNSGYRHEFQALNAPVDAHAFAQSLTASGGGVLRAKGWLTHTDGQRWLLQVVGKHAELTPAHTPQARPPDGVLVIRHTPPNMA